MWVQNIHSHSFPHSLLSASPPTWMLFQKMVKPEVECPQWIWPWKIPIREKRKKKREARDPWFGILGIFEQNRAGLSFLRGDKTDLASMEREEKEACFNHMHHTDLLPKLNGQGWNDRPDNVTDFPSGSPRTQLIWNSEWWESVYQVLVGGKCAFRDVWPSAWPLKMMICSRGFVWEVWRLMMDGKWVGRSWPRNNNKDPVNPDNGLLKSVPKRPQM